jgi:hypothetical protein
MNSDKLCNLAEDIMFFPLDTADKLPKGILRFAGYVLALPCGLVTGLLGSPFLLIALLVEMWEEANRQR